MRTSKGRRNDLLVCCKYKSSFRRQSRLPSNAPGLQRSFAQAFEASRAHARKIDQIATATIPGYLFVEIDPEISPWRAIRSTVGIFDVIRFGEKPAPVPDAVIDEILARQDKNGLVKTLAGAAFKAGSLSALCAVLLVS